ncbi:MAG: SMP-30/gluconolactonase/LRE family protein [Bryobacteraceae bacterium]
MKTGALAILATSAVMGQPDSTLLATGWRVRPAGRQIPLGPIPLASALTPDGRFLAVLTRGPAPAIAVLDARTEKEISRTSVAGAGLGLVVTPNGRTLYVSGGPQAAVFEFAIDAAGKLAAARRFDVVPPAERTPRHFIGDIALTTDGRMIYAADLYQDQVVVINPSGGRVIDRFKTGRRPSRILFHPDGKSYFVTSWADGTLYHHETENGHPLGALRLGPQPMDMIWNTLLPELRLFVAAANTNKVYVAGLTAAKQMRVVETINTALTLRQPLGMTPSALALSPKQDRLYVVCSDANAVAVADVYESPARLLGFIPTAAYPVAARTLSDGRLVVLNGRGESASVIDPFAEAGLAQHTNAVFQNTPYRDDLLDLGTTAPVRHVVYIAGGVAGSGPNYRKLAAEFVRLENFYSTGGYLWSVAAISPPFVERLGLDGYDGGEPAAIPPAGYLWTNAAAAGLTIRNFGHFVENTKAAAPAGEVQVESVRDRQLEKLTSFRYRGPDPLYADAERVKVVLEELKGWEASGEMPRLSLLRLGGDSADGDAALGMLVEALSKSRFWPAMAIFAAGAAPRGARATALVVSPYTRSGAAVNMQYNTLSMLRTIELILDLQPMTHFDAAAPPMLAVFTGKPDTRPYTAVR